MIGFLEQLNRDFVGLHLDPDHAVIGEMLAEKYGLSVKTIQNRAYKEGWKKRKGKIEEKAESKLPRAWCGRA